MAEHAPGKTPEEIEKELSVGNFTKQQARTLGFQFGGMAAGAGLGYAAAKAGLGKSLDNKALVKAFGGTKSVLVGIGTIVGSVIGCVASLYEHWVKVEREQLNVQEINKDVATLMEKRVEFEDTLDKQGEMVKAMLARQEATGITQADKIASRREQDARSEKVHA